MKQKAGCKSCFRGWSSSHADTAALDNLHRMRIQLLMQSIAPDLTAAHLELLTARMKPESSKAFKHMMVRPGLLSAWEGLDAAAKDFSKLLTGKEMAVPSAAWKLFPHPCRGAGALAGLYGVKAQPRQSSSKCSLFGRKWL